MKNLFFGAMTALLVSGSALANETKESKSVVDVKQMQTYCRITVTTTHANGTKTTETTLYPVSSGQEGAKQCNAIKNKVIASLEAN